MTIVKQEVVASLPYSGRDDAHGWQEVRILVVNADTTNKVSKQKLKAEIVIGKQPYGEISTWSSSVWKPIVRVDLNDLPPMKSHWYFDADLYRDKKFYEKAIAWLFAVGSKVVDD